MDQKSQINVKEVINKRFIEFAFTSQTKDISIKLSNGSKAKGKFYTANPEQESVVVKNFVQDSSAQNQTANTFKNEIVPTKVLNSNDFVYFLVTDVDPEEIKIKQAQEIKQITKKTNTIKTDTEISNKIKQKSKDLVKWDLETTDGSGTLETLDNPEQYKVGDFDQFQVNEKQFGIKSDFMMENYTTQLDLTQITKEQKQKAQQIENELKQQQTNASRHILEERGLLELTEDNQNQDEEAVYSAVLGSGAYQNYTIDEPMNGSQKNQEQKPAKPCPIKFVNKNKQTEGSGTAQETPSSPKTTTLQTNQQQNDLFKQLTTNNVQPQPQQQQQQQAVQNQQPNQVRTQPQVQQQPQQSQQQAPINTQVAQKTQSQTPINPQLHIQIYPQQQQSQQPSSLRGSAHNIAQQPQVQTDLRQSTGQSSQSSQQKPVVLMNLDQLGDFSGDSATIKRHSLQNQQSIDRVNSLTSTDQQLLPKQVLSKQNSNHSQSGANSALRKSLTQQQQQNIMLNSDGQSSASAKKEKENMNINLPYHAPIDKEKKVPALPSSKFRLKVSQNEYFKTQNKFILFCIENIEEKYCEIKNQDTKWTARVLEKDKNKVKQQQQALQQQQTLLSMNKLQQTKSPTSTNNAPDFSIFSQQKTGNGGVQTNTKPNQSNSYVPQQQQPQQQAYQNTNYPNQYQNQMYSQQSPMSFNQIGSPQQPQQFGNKQQSYNMMNQNASYTYNNQQFYQPQNMPYTGQMNQTGYQNNYGGKQMNQNYMNPRGSYSKN